MISQELLTKLAVLDWGYTEESFPRSFSQFKSWLDEKKEGSLSYLSDHRAQKRSDLKEVYPDFQSALVFLFSYRETKKWLIEHKRHEIASYALGFGGEDYHFTLKKYLELILADLQKTYPDLKGFVSLDAQPVLERDLAHRAGLGWFGKNSMLINRKEGSYFIIGSLLLNQKLPSQTKSVDVDHCGQCRACIDACPTEAIDIESRTLIADKCISTFTIEMMKEVNPPEGMEKSRGEFFGCDICQDVCPWNTKPLARTPGNLNLEKYPAVAKIFHSGPNELLNYFETNSGRGIQRDLFGSALSRPGKKGWEKNLRFVISNRTDS